MSNDGGYMHKYKQQQSVKDDTKSIVSNTKSNKSNMTNISKKKELDKQDLLERMRQSDEIHKRVMVDNQKRRREQERKLKQQEDDQKLTQAQVLGQRKKTKEEAYVNYLRSNSKTVLDGLKSSNQQQSKTQYPKTNIPKVPTQAAQTNYDQFKQVNTFQALDVELYKKKNIIEQHQSQNKLRQEFEKSWAKEEEFDVMRKSELLDSLDLETKPTKKKQGKENYIEELIGYEEANSEEEDDVWNVNKVGKRETRKLQQINSLPHRVIEEEQVPQPTTKPVKVISKIQVTQNIQPQITQPPNKKTTKPQMQQRRASPNTQATRDLNVDVQQFLKEDMMHINQEEQQVQRDLVQINSKNYKKIQEINQKYNIRTNLVSSQQVRNPDAKITKQVDEESIAASILRIDNMLVQKQGQKVESQHQFQAQQNYNQQQQQRSQQQQQPPQNQYQAPQNYQNQQPPQNQYAPYQQPLQNQQQSPQNQYQPPYAQQQPQQVQNQYQSPLQAPISQQQQQTPQFPAFPQIILHQDHQSFQKTTNSYPKQNIYNAHQDTTIQRNDPYNYNINEEPIQTQEQNNFELTQNTAEQITQLLMQNPQLLEKLGYQNNSKQQPPIKEEIKEEDLQVSQHPSVDGRTFRISKAKGKNDMSMVSTQSKQSGYAQVAAVKKMGKPISEEIVEQEDEAELDGRIKMTGNAQLLFD